MIFLSFFVFGAVAPFILTLGYIWVDTFRPQEVAWFVMNQLPVAQLRHRRIGRLCPVGPPVTAPVHVRHVAYSAARLLDYVDDALGRGAGGRLVEVGLGI